MKNPSRRPTALAYKEHLRQVAVQAYYRIRKEVREGGNAEQSIVYVLRALKAEVAKSYAQGIEAGRKKERRRAWLARLAGRR